MSAARSLLNQDLWSAGPPGWLQHPAMMSHPAFTTPSQWLNWSSPSTQGCSHDLGRACISSVSSVSSTGTQAAVEGGTNLAGGR